MTDPGGIHVGLMSGTSLDGISAAVVRFDAAGGQFTHELLGFESIPYDARRRARLQAAMTEGSAAEYCALGFELGEWLAEAAGTAVANAGVAMADVRAISSHGQTIWHSPRQSTLQIGESAVIAERTGVDVVSDFRVRDVAAGGEGAPLVPIADAMLYSAPDRWRVLQNIGGIGNLTIVPPGGDLSRIRAFDTGPGVVVVDYVVRKLYPQLRFDDHGEIAARGRVHERLVDELLRASYFVAPPPKSTGRELFSASFAERLITALGDHAPPEDVVATAVALTARSIAAAIRDFVDEPATEMVVSGGGARNETLVKSLRSALPAMSVALFDDVYYNGEAKEAVAFALLGYLHLARRPANVIGATGARGPRVLGKLTPA